jgi:hypothetical protein
MYSLFVVGFAALVLAYLKYRRVGRVRLPLPPGPKRLPIIGNARDLDYGSVHPWVRYAEWAATYGDVVYLEIFGESMVILNSLEGVTEIFEKRSANYSDRPGGLITVT